MVVPWSRALQVICSDAVPDLFKARYLLRQKVHLEIDSEVAG